MNTKQTEECGVVQPLGPPRENLEDKMINRIVQYPKQYPLLHNGADQTRCLTLADQHLPDPSAV